MPDRQSARAFRFADFVLDVSAYELRMKNRAIRVERRPMELLFLLVNRPGELVTREEIVDRLWGRDVFIDAETSVNTAIRKVRRALHESASRPRFIETVQGKGYRFIAEVESLAPIVLAVLPVENLNREAEIDYVADGLTEEISTALGQVDPEHLSVIARTSSVVFRGTATPLDAIGRQLGADYLLEGSVRTSGNRLRLIVKLIRVRDQLQVWTETYERQSDDLLGLQTEVGRAVASHIHLRLSSSRAATIATRQTQSSAAYDAYLRGCYYWSQMTPATAARALDCFRRATAIDPGYALAFAGISHTYSSQLHTSDARPAEVAGEARAAAQQALAHGDGVADAYVAVATVQFLFDWDWKSAERNLRHAVSLDPNSVQAHWMLGHTLSQLQKHEQALAEARRVRELDPVSALSHSMCAQIAFSARDAEGAAEHARAALLAEPDYWVAHYQLGQACQQLGRLDEALRALDEASRLSNGNSKPAGLLVYTLAKMGRSIEARERLAILEQRGRERYFPPYAIALAHAGLGEETAVFRWLGFAFAERDIGLVTIMLDAKWDSYRNDERFRTLSQKIFG